MSRGKKRLRNTELTSSYCQSEVEREPTSTHTIQLVCKYIDKFWSMSFFNTFTFFQHQNENFNPQNKCKNREEKLDNGQDCTYYLREYRFEESISPTFYAQHLHVQIPKAQQRLTAWLYFFALGICVPKIAHKILVK